jgi:hypothetical protein
VVTPADRLGVAGSAIEAPLAALKAQLVPIGAQQRDQGAVGIVADQCGVRAMERSGIRVIPMRFQGVIPWPTPALPCAD